MPIPRQYRNAPAHALPKYVRARYARPAATRRLSRPVAVLTLAGQLCATVTAQSAIAGLAAAVIILALLGPSFWGE